MQTRSGLNVKRVRLMSACTVNNQRLSIMLVYATALDGGNFQYRLSLRHGIRGKR